MKAAFNPSTPLPDVPDVPVVLRWQQWLYVVLVGEVLAAVGYGHWGTVYCDSI